MATDTPKTDALQSTVALVAEMLRGAQSARHLPNVRAHEARSLNIYGDSYTNSNALDNAKEFKRRFEAERRAAGEAERDARLAEIALALEAARVVLPGLAPAACIELGETARALEGEARREAP